MENIKTDGAQALTLHVVPVTVQPRITPVKKLKPEKASTRPVEKVVYKDHMEKMTNRDWTAVKKRLRFVLDEMNRDYDCLLNRFLMFPTVAPPKSAQRKMKKARKDMIDALEKLLNWEGSIGSTSFLTKEDFRPSNWYRFHVGPDAIYEPDSIFPTKNLDKHSDALKELERVKNGQYDHSGNSPIGFIAIGPNTKASKKK